MKAIKDILYRPRGRFRSGKIGAHSSSEVGGFGVFRDQAPFLRHPDSRRIDLRATLRDPFGETHVRRFEQRNGIDVVALVDVSASMRVTAKKFEIACDLCAALAFSATRIGDRFGLIACGATLRREHVSPATRSTAMAIDAVERLRASSCADSSAEGLIQAAKALAGSRKLVFLISDFRWPIEFMQRTFSTLSMHDLAPLILIDSIEENPPNWGLLELIDSESGRRRVMLMRPSLKSRWIEEQSERRRLIAYLASGCARRPIFLRDGFDPVDLSLRLMAA